MNAMPYKLGKLPARKGAVSFLYEEYTQAAALPRAPLGFGHHDLIQDWHMLGNDKHGNCVWAGAAHEEYVWSLEGGRPRTRITTHDVLSDYSKVTGFVEGKPETDNGTDMQQAASYRRKTGILTATGKRKKIEAYLALRVGDYDQIVQATWLFGATGLGFQFPKSAMAQFDGHEPWDVSAGATISGGHYVACVGRAMNGNLITISWGRKQEMTRAFYERYSDESLAYVSASIINEKQISPEGFGLAELNQDLKRLAA